jgi:hypothetical protein
MDLGEYENKLIRYNNEDLIKYLMRIGMLKNGVLCQFCSVVMKFSTYADVKDFAFWRCINTKFNKYKSRTNIRIGSFLLD